MDEIRTIKEAIQRTKWAIEEWSRWKDSSDPMQGACQVRMSHSSLSEAQNALSRLEAREAETPKDATALALLICDEEQDALLVAAEIERYVQARIEAAILAERDEAFEAAYAKNVPLSMLKAIRSISAYAPIAEMHRMASSYGYTITED